MRRDILLRLTILDNGKNKQQYPSSGGVQIQTLINKINLLFSSETVTKVAKRVEYSCKIQIFMINGTKQTNFAFHPVNIFITEIKMFMFSVFLFDHFFFVFRDKENVSVIAALQSKLILSNSCQSMINNWFFIYGAMKIDKNGKCS